MSNREVKVGLMGATGLVGTEMLRILEARAFPVSELRALRIGAFARAQAALRRRRRDVRGPPPGLFRRPRSRDRRRRRPARGRVGSRRGRRGRAGGRQLGRIPHGSRRAAGDRGSEPRRPPFAAEEHRVVPQLHDDDPRDRARAAAPRGAARPHGGVFVPIGVGRRPGRYARARRAVDEAGRPERRPARVRER